MEVGWFGKALHLPISLGRLLRQNKKFTAEWFAMLDYLQ